MKSEIWWDTLLFILATPTPVIPTRQGPLRFPEGNRMHKNVKPKELNIHEFIAQFPHCDQRILHSPSECEFCDRHPEWQALRQAWGIAFTGYEPDEKELPCPATHARGDGVNVWPGNRAK